MALRLCIETPEGPSPLLGEKTARQVPLRETAEGFEKYEYQQNGIAWYLDPHPPPAMPVIRAADII